MVFYDPMVLETHGITDRNLLAKNRHDINKHVINSRKKGKNEYVTKYVVEHVPKHPPSNTIGVCTMMIPNNMNPF
jgi:hypothetical protein